MSCATKIEYIYKVPDFVEPIFPEPNVAELNDNQTVTVDLNWFVNVAKYKIEVESVFEYFEKLKELENEH